MRIENLLLFYNHIVNLQKGVIVMIMQEKHYTPDQISDAEKLCQLLQKIPDTKRQIFSISALAYMSGFEAGIVAGRDEAKVV